MVFSKCFLNTDRPGASITLPGSLFQCLTTLTGKNFFPSMSSQSEPPLGKFVLSLCILERLDCVFRGFTTKVISNNVTSVIHYCKIQAKVKFLEFQDLRDIFYFFLITNIEGKRIFQPWTEILTYTWWFSNWYLWLRVQHQHTGWRLIFSSPLPLLSALQRFHALWVCQLPSWAGTVWFVFNARTASFNSLFCLLFFLFVFFCICNFMGTDSGTNIQGRPGAHIALISTHKGFLELCHTPACNIPHSKLAPNSPAITAAFSLKPFCFWHLFICYTVLMLWILPFQRMEIMLRGDTNTLQCRNF